MNKKTSEKVADVIFWIAAPTMMATENHQKKWVRVLGVLGMFLLFPLMAIGFLLGFVAIMAEMFIEI